MTRPGNNPGDVKAARIAVSIQFAFALLAIVLAGWLIAGWIS